jgi:hypothetical protein
MSTSNLIEMTVVFDDAYTGVEKFGRVDRVYGDDAIVRIITMEEAGPEPRRIVSKPDRRIAEIAGGTSVVVR